MKIINGDLLEIESGVICHQVNCQKVAGAGLARQIRNKWPAWYEHFLNVSPILGRVDLWRASDKIMIASLYSQFGFGTKTRHTDYGAFEVCLKKLAGMLELAYFPFGIGAGLAGGDWKVIEGLIETNFPNAILVKKN